MDAKRINELATIVEKVSEAHCAAKRKEESARRETTIALNNLNQAEKKFDEAVEEFRNERSDNFDNRWGKKFQRKSEAELAA